VRYTSQAKGPVERGNLTLQDRLVMELRLGGISTLAAANAYAPSFMAVHNRHFAKPPRTGLNVHWPVRQDEDRDLIFAVREPRKVSHVLTLQYHKTMCLLAETSFTRALIGKYIDGDEFEITQEFLSAMLDVHRPNISVVAGLFQQAGIVRYTRGRMKILDRARACRQLTAVNFMLVWTIKPHGYLFVRPKEEPVNGTTLCAAGRSMGSHQGITSGREETVGATARDNRLFVEAVLYRHDW
jgi:hypothetical protein